MQKKTIFFITVFPFLLTACQEPLPPAKIACALDMEKAMDEYHELINDNDPENDPLEPPRECVIPAREPGADMKFNVSLADFTSEQEQRMRDALERAKLVLNSAEFKERVLNHEFNGEKTFHDNNDMTNQEIYEHVMLAAETLMPEVDEEMDLDITLYYRNNSTVGYTYPDTTRVWVNSKFFSANTLGEIAANAVHEWTHKLGFGHSHYNNPQRPFSVPYGIGTIVEEIVDKM